MPIPTNIHQHRHRGSTKSQFNRFLKTSQERSSVLMHGAAAAVVLGTALLTMTVPLSKHVKNQVDGVMQISRPAGPYDVQVELKTRTPKLDDSGRPWPPRDVLVEDEHIWPDGSEKCLGWLHSDQPTNAMFSTAWLQTDRVFLAPYRALIETARANWDEWTATYRMIEPPTYNDAGQLVYRSRNLPVPIDVLLTAIPGARFVDTSTGRVRRLVDGRLQWSAPRPIPTTEDLDRIVTSPSDEVLESIFGTEEAR